METCCSIKFNNRRDLVIEEMKKEMVNLAKTEADIFPDSKIGNWMKLIWDLMEKPETSIASRIMNFISISMILLSTMGMCLNTISIVAGKINQRAVAVCTIQNSNMVTSLIMLIDIDEKLIRLHF